MTTLLSKPNAIHATLMIVNQKGILLTGKSGIGKTTLALQLLDRSHQLVADDLVEIKTNHSQIMGTCPPKGLGLIHHKQLGILDIRQRFGQQAAQPEYAIDCMIELTKKATSTPTPLTMPFKTQSLHQQKIKHLTLPTTPPCQLAILVELVAEKA